MGGSHHGDSHACRWSLHPRCCLCCWHLQYIAADIPSIAVRQLCPPSASFFGFMGCACALVFACLGAAYGTAKSGVGVANMGVLHADMVMKSIIPIIMAGVLGIYGLIVAVLLG